jgi:hypothetical protein
MGLVAQMRAAALEAHRGTIGIGGADAKISGAPVESMDLAQLPSHLSDPIVPHRVRCSKLPVEGLL